MRVTALSAYEKSRTSLEVRWLRLCVPRAHGRGSIPGPGTKIPRATQQKKKKSELFLVKGLYPETQYSFHTHFLIVREMTNRTKKTTTDYRNRCVNDPVIGCYQVTNIRVTVASIFKKRWQDRYLDNIQSTCASWLSHVQGKIILFLLSLLVVCVYICSSSVGSMCVCVNCSVMSGSLWPHRL